MRENIRLFAPYLKERFGKKVYKVSLDAGMTCPNRDGKIDTRGCIFCSAGGSGDFAQDRKLSITKQLELGKKLIAAKLPKGECAYIAYFQAFTNTYAPISYLRRVYSEAAKDEEVCAISIATRPDCIDEDVVALIAEINKIKPVFVELGLQTSCEETARYIRRGYDNSVFEKAVNLLAKEGIEIIVHMIIGLKGENKDTMVETVRYINRFPVKGVKFQLLHILEGTDLAKEYQKGEIRELSMEEYIDILMECIDNLREDIVIHRMTGDGPKKLLIAPKWSGDKKRVLNAINHALKSGDR